MDNKEHLLSFKNYGFVQNIIYFDIPLLDLIYNKISDEFYFRLYIDNNHGYFILIKDISFDGLFQIDLREYILESEEIIYFNKFVSGLVIYSMEEVLKRSDFKKSLPEEGLIINIKKH